ncbi:hypothetical protein Bbelb_251520 [Branchiostoma belcheri]|nr:hypothetical protein Bbelb_251520 [Branchiostoma belcheri]
MSTSQEAERLIPIINHLFKWTSFRRRTCHMFWTSFVSLRRRTGSKAASRTIGSNLLERVRRTVNTPCRAQEEIFGALASSPPLRAQSRRFSSLRADDKKDNGVYRTPLTSKKSHDKEDNGVYRTQLTSKKSRHYSPSRG